jgi:hypothetical protein
MPSPATISGAKPEFGDVPVIDESTTAPTLFGEGVAWADITIDSTLLNLDSGLLEYNALDWSWGHPTDSLAIERRRPTRRKRFPMHQIMRRPPSSWMMPTLHALMQKSGSIPGPTMEGIGAVAKMNSNSSLSASRNLASWTRKYDSEDPES